MTIDQSNTSGSKTSTETLDWETLVAEFEGVSYPFYHHPAYEFSRKTFIEDDSAGVYEDD